MGGRSAADAMFHRQIKLLNVSPHQYSAPMACLSTRSGSATFSSCGRKCTGVWIGGGGRGSIIFSLRYCCDWSIVLARSILERALNTSSCADVWSRIQCKSGVILLSRPK